MATRSAAPARIAAADPTRLPLLFVAALFAIAAPTLLAYNVSPSPTFLNQALALGGWGALVLLLAWGPRPASSPGLAASTDAWPVQAALALLMAAALGSGTAGSLPASLCLSALGLLGATALVVHSGAASARGSDAPRLFALFCAAWLLAGLLNLAIGLVQVFLPTWPDGDWLAASGIVGRAVGNLRQPNHLSSVLVWAVLAAVALRELRHIGPRLAWLCVAALVFGVVLTASRTGMLSVAVLALWGLADRRLSRGTRLLLLATPLLYALSWLGMDLWARLGQHTFGGAARLAETDVSGSRFGIWGNTLALIRAQPWTGVGLGEFNLAWTLTPFPGRPTAFFDHTHNLPLQLAVELGLPLAALVLALLLWGLWRMAVLAWQTADEAGDGYGEGLSIARRTAFLFVLMIGLHSLLEYPLWYAYFLLPTAWAFGFGLGRGAPRTIPVTTPLTLPGAGLLAPAGALLVLLTAFAVWDYGRVTTIFAADDDAASLDERIERGQRSVFFAHHANYAAATTPEIEPRLRAHAFDSATHYLLDTRLMMAWARERAERGELEQARHLVARLREFNNPLARDWLDACNSPAPASAQPFQCALPAQTLGWRALLP